MTLENQAEKRKNSRVIDMTKGNPIQLMLLFAIPMMIGSIFQCLYSMVDSAVLGRFVGSHALAAIGATGSTTGFLMMLANSVSSAVSIIISQYAGAGDRVRIKRSFVSSLSLLASLGILLGLAGIFLARPIMLLLKTPEDILDMSVLYIQLICGFGIMQFLYNWAASILRALGDSRTPLCFLILCSVLNVILDLFAVLVLQWGVAGVAFATVGSQAISAILCIIVMFKRFPELVIHKEDLRPDRETLVKIISMGLKMALQSAMLSVGMMVITRIINSFGSNVIAAFTVGSNIQSLCVMLFSNFSFGFSVYVGQNFGARDVKRIQKGVRDIAFLVGCIAAVVGVLAILFAGALVSLYVKPEETEVVQYSIDFVRIQSCFLPVLGWIWLYLSTIKGMGKIGITMISSTIELACKIGFSILLPLFMGVKGIWFAAPSGWVLGIIPNLLYYYSGLWKKLMES